MYMHNRDEGYRLRVTLAALDHNRHLGRKQAVNQFGELRSHRTYRKRTKRWDTIPVLEPKSYDHIEELISQVFHYRSTSVDLVRARAAPKPPTHPEMIHPTTAQEAPPPTSEISENKKSRFASFQSKS